MKRNLIILLAFIAGTVALNLALSPAVRHNVVRVTPAAAADNAYEGRPIAGEYQVVAVQLDRAGERSVTGIVVVDGTSVQVDGYVSFVKDGTFEICIQFVANEYVVYDNLVSGLWSRSGETVVLSTALGLLELAITRQGNDVLLLSDVVESNMPMVGLMLVPIDFPRTATFQPSI